MSNIRLPSEVQSALRGSSQSVKRAASRALAKESTWEDAQELYGRVKFTELSWTRLLPLTLRLLDEARLPAENKSEEQIKACTEIAWWIVSALANMDLTVVSTPWQGTIWPKLFPWLVMLSDTNAEAIMGTEATEASIACLAAMCHFAVTDAASASAIATPGCLRLIVASWKRCCLPKNREKQITGYALGTVYHLLMKADTAPTSEIIEACGLRANDIAQMTSHTLETARRNWGGNIVPFFILATTTFWIACDRSLDSIDLRRAWVKRGTLSETCRVLDHIVNSNYNSQVGLALVKLIHRMTWKTGAGAWAIAIEGGIIESTAMLLDRSNDRERKKTLELARAILFGGVGMVLWDTRVVDALRNRMTSFRKATMLPVFAVTESTCQWQALWEEFAGRTVRYHLLMGEERRRMCAKCGIIVEGSGLKRCGGCICTYYCDKACQRNDWKRHKEECAARAQNRAYAQDMGLNSESREFIRRVMAFDLRAIPDKVRSDVIRQARGEDVVLVHDYRSSIIIIDVADTDSCMREGLFESAGGQTRKCGSTAEGDCVWMVPRYSTQEMNLNWWRTLDDEKVETIFH
ncbi:MYND-type domain-containing protein [Mycena indigotica]|uniref:MYND-type domain-containing protein n=1 Tax=Mycena indigotica TaxID=2126181 RepID=A0A8H6T7W0_9AGAR|nr:MYND-type domain-containing protein [Mycena indigotica]KAF7311962.1 MYND-type domain-containing protein [Mycena indigotica]